MTKPVERVYAKDLRKGMWVMVTVEKDSPIRVQVRTVNEKNRGFVTMGFTHATTGSHKLEFARFAQLDLAP